VTTTIKVNPHGHIVEISNQEGDGAPHVHVITGVEEITYFICGDKAITIRELPKELDNA
jgi:hypothetical protein